MIFLSGSSGLVINWPAGSLVDLLVCPASPVWSGLSDGWAGSCGRWRWMSGGESVVPQGEHGRAWGASDLAAVARVGAYRDDDTAPIKRCPDDLAPVDSSISTIPQSSEHFDNFPLRSEPSSQSLLSVTIC